MTSYSYQYPSPLWTNDSIRPEFRAGRIGMMVGGMAAVAENLHAYRSGTKNQQQAVQDTLRTTVYAGASASVADYVYRQIGRGDWLASLAAVSAGSAMMYFLLRTDDRMRTKAQMRADAKDQDDAEI